MLISFGEGSFHLAVSEVRKLVHHNSLYFGAGGSGRGYESVGFFSCQGLVTSSTTPVLSVDDALEAYATCPYVLTHYAIVHRRFKRRKLPATVSGYFARQEA